MLPILRPANLFLIFTYLALSLVPFVPLLFGRAVDGAVRVVGTEVVAWVAMWAVFSRPRYFHVLLLPAFIAVPAELYLNAYYNEGISSHHLGIIAETSPGEAIEFLGHRFWVFIATLFAFMAWWALSWRAAARSVALDWRDDSRWIAIALLSAGFGLWMYGKEFGVEKATSLSSAGVSNTSSRTLRSSSPAGFGAGFPSLPAWASIPFDARIFASTWPFGLSIRASEFWKEKQYLSDLAEKSREFRFGAHQTGTLAVPQLVVMVIGESSRFDRWGLNGYQRDTTPLLKKEANLISLSNVITAVSATRLSVPVLVSRKPATQSLKAGFKEKSFLSAFKEAGFKTYWISNQMSFGQFDTPVSVFAKEADVTKFLNLGGFNSKVSYDEVLLAPLKSALSDSSPKKLIVVHTLGNHWNYSHRHPPEFDKWQPSLYGIDNPVYTDLNLKQQLNNSYDNSILYTDWFLSQVIQALKSSSQMASMIYVADHGQTLYDGNCKLAFHGHNTQFEFHVPALVWYSELYRIAHPGKVNELLKNRRAKLSTENIFHSLVDMADIRYQSEQLEWSFLSREFRQHKRYVDSYGWTDYDNAYFKGDCREVIDRGTPLKQEK